MSSPNRPISRLGGASESPEEPILLEMFARIRASRGHILNIHYVTAHAPKLLRATAAYARALREESSLPRDLQELLILRIAQINDSAYEQSVHRPIAVTCGVSSAKIDALPNWCDTSLFDAKERAALSFIEQAARRGDVDDDVFGEASQCFSAQELVELAALTAWYVGNSRFVRALQVANEQSS